MTGKLTTKYVPEFPLIVMQIPSDQFLSRRLLTVIL